ncbi:hypothetical protein [Planctomicrobium sp. SH527]|uniref:hypothetical protein n=1 Tax=Planctomicrobium sp. SH527 TaxID=3448123 RepID=UPI003F5BE6DF
MAQCQGFFRDFVVRDSQATGNKRAVQVDISHPSEVWCQFHIIDGKKSARLSIPMTAFYELVQRMDGLMEAQG